MIFEFKLNYIRLNQIDFLKNQIISNLFFLRSNNYKYIKFNQK